MVILHRMSFCPPRLSYIAKRSLSISGPTSSPSRSLDLGLGYESTHEPGRPIIGPLGQAPNHGAPTLTPVMLKAHLDKYVVGQNKAKKVTSVALYNHYTRIQEVQRRQAKERHMKISAQRTSHQAMFTGSSESDIESKSHSYHSSTPSEIPTSNPLPAGSISLPLDPLPIIIEKSNLLLLGPSGVGKTYILTTLSRILDVPFATVDCSSLTQAGYIGSDVETAIERLLLASDYSPERSETGIIFFDELDKLAKPAVVTHGRDVSGEGVQQGLLKMIEGTTVTVLVKGERNASRRVERPGLSGASGAREEYSVDTSQILFVFAGAFLGLEKIIEKRLKTGSGIGFGAELASDISPVPSSSSNSNQPNHSKPQNLLQYVTPLDLQAYGLIPELLGRIPILTSLASLSHSQLVSILTEPRNALVKQYIQLFSSYGIELRFTAAALWSIAERTLKGGTGPQDQMSRDERAKNDSSIGARGLRSVMESVLGEIMFRGPGSENIKYCLVDEEFVRHQGRSAGGNGNGEVEIEEGAEEMPKCFSRGEARAFEHAWREEEYRWWREYGGDRGGLRNGSRNEEGETLVEWRVAGVSGM